MSKYKLDKGEWGEIEAGLIYKVQCCDCSLVHDYEYKKVKGKMFVRTKRDERATGQLRRYKKEAAIEG